MDRAATDKDRADLRHGQIVRVHFGHAIESGAAEGTIYRHHGRCWLCWSRHPFCELLTDAMRQRVAMLLAKSWWDGYPRPWWDDELRRCRDAPASAE